MNISYKEYKEYISSEKWLDTKKEFAKHNDKKCQACDSKTKLSAHHKTYRNLGKERIEGELVNYKWKNPDLCYLCETCHNEVHKVARIMGIGMRTDNWYADGTHLWYITNTYIKMMKYTGKSKRPTNAWNKLVDKSWAVRAGTYLSKKQQNHLNHPATIVNGVKNKEKDAYMKKFNLVN